MLLELQGEFLFKGGNGTRLKGFQVFLPGFKLSFSLSKCPILLLEHGLHFHEFLHDVVVKFDRLLGFLTLEAFVHCIRN